MPSDTDAMQSIDALRLVADSVLCLKVPMLACTGNHEIEAESDGKNSIFTSVQARWKVLPVRHGVPGHSIV